MIPVQALVVVLRCCAPEVAEAPSSHETNIARELFERAENAFAEGDYELALALWERVQRADPNDITRIKIALVLVELGRIAQAHEILEEVASGTQLAPALRADALKRAVELDALLASLEVRGGTWPVGIDGARACTSPCTVVLDPGLHEIAVGEPSTATFRRELSFDPGQDRHLELRLSTPHSPRLGPLAWVGVGLGTLGGAGIIGLGLRTRALQRSYLATPSQELRTQGLRTRVLTNISIGVVVVGAALLVTDLVVHARRRRRASSQLELVR